LDEKYGAYIQSILFLSSIISHHCIIQLVESYRAILEQAQSITGVTYLPSANGNSNGNASAGGRPASASSVHRGAGQGALTQEVMDGMLQNATYGMQMLDVALRAKTLQGPGPPTSQHYPQQHQPQHPSQPHHHHQPPLNSTSSLTAHSSTQMQQTSSTTSITAVGSSSGSSYGYNTNSHPHPQQNSNSNTSSPRIMKDGGGGGGADDGGRKVKSEGSVDKGILANGTSAAMTADAATGATGPGSGSAPMGGDRSKRQVGYCRFCLP
jgi:hypothetical protein